jgi:hypothetical protein
MTEYQQGLGLESRRRLDAVPLLGNYFASHDSLLVWFLMGTHLIAPRVLTVELLLCLAFYL